MNLEELMILFIPQVAFFQGVKLSKFALPYSSTNKKIKELQLESGDAEWLKCWCVLRGGYGPLFIQLSEVVLSHNLRISTQSTDPLENHAAAQQRQCQEGSARGWPAQGTERSLGGAPQPLASHVGAWASSHEGCIRGNCSGETSLDVLVI